MRISDNYHIEELVHPEIIDRFGAEKVAKYTVVYAPWLVYTQQSIREWCGCPVTVNNYLWDPDYKAGGWEAIKDRADLYINSGVRNLSQPFGNNFSGHYAFTCTDSKPRDYDTGQLQDDILRNRKVFPHVVRMESAKATRSSRGALGRDWLHTQSGLIVTDRKVEVYLP